jgi:hypothetical protein
MCYNKLILFIQFLSSFFYNFFPYIFFKKILYKTKNKWCFIIVIGTLSYFSTALKINLKFDMSYNRIWSSLYLIIYKYKLFNSRFYFLINVKKSNLKKKTYDFKRMTMSLTKKIKLQTKPNSIPQIKTLNNTMTSNLKNKL